MRFTPVADSPDFDYGAFLRDDAMDVSGDASASASSPSMEDGSNKSNGSPDAHAGTVASSSTDLVSANNQAAAAAARQRLERRGHTKSRRGCFNCKRRRIKVTSRRIPSWQLC